MIGHTPLLMLTKVTKGSGAEIIAIQSPLSLTRSLSLDVLSLSPSLSMYI